MVWLVPIVVARVFYFQTFIAPHSWCVVQCTSHMWLIVASVDMWCVQQDNKAEHVCELVWWTTFTGKRRDEWSMHRLIALIAMAQRTLWLQCDHSRMLNSIFLIIYCFHLVFFMFEEAQTNWFSLTLIWIFPFPSIHHRYTRSPSSAPKSEWPHVFLKSRTTYSHEHIGVDFAIYL